MHQEGEGTGQLLKTREAIRGYNSAPAALLTPSNPCLGHMKEENSKCLYQFLITVLNQTALRGPAALHSPCRSLPPACSGHSICFSTTPPTLWPKCSWQIPECIYSVAVCCNPSRRCCCSMHTVCVHWKGVLQRNGKEGKMLQSQTLEISGNHDLRV